MNALEIRLGITPRAVAFFQKHRKVYRRSEYYTDDPDRRLLLAGLDLLDKALAVRPELEAQAAQLRLDKLRKQKMSVHFWREILRGHRQTWWPWFFNPLAWRARIHRNAAHNECKNLLRAVLASLPPENFYKKTTVNFLSQ